MLNRLKKVTNQQTQRMVYCALARSHIIYCLPVWGFMAKTYFLRIHRLLNGALRSICGLGRYDSVSLRYNELNLLTFEQEIIEATCRLAHDHVYYGMRSNVGLNFAVSDNPSNPANRLRVPFCRLSLNRHSILAKGPILWNALPDNVCSTPTKLAFDKALRISLFADRAQELSHGAISALVHNLY
jgi:hypothetical protein